MYDQPRYKPYAASSFFEDGTSARTPVPGTVARGQLRTDAHFYEGMIEGKDAETFPFLIDRTGLERGKERFTIYCSMCHGASGDGRGVIVRRGFSPPPSFHAPKPSNPRPESPAPVVYADLRKAPVGHFFRVITYGHGAMYSYAARVQPADRWKIAAYIRALQLSQGATLEDLKSIPDPTPEERRLIEEAER
jgi:mono/diheme cytochrome c family protein